MSTKTGPTPCSSAGADPLQGRTDVSAAAPPAVEDVVSLLLVSKVPKELSEWGHG